MDHRFSTLFFQPPRTPPSPEDTSMSGALPDPNTLGKRKSTTMKQLLKKLFGIPRQTTDPLIKTAEPVPSALSQQVWSEFSSITKTPSKASSTLKKTSTLKKSPRTSGTDSNVVVAPPGQPLPAFKRRDFFHKSSSSSAASISSSVFSSKRTSTAANSVRDSKFSSISSLPSLASLALLPHPSRTSSPGPSLSLSVDELALLQSLIRKIARQLKKQEYLTNHLAGNLVSLFGRKEAQIHSMKRLRVQEREIGAREVWRVKEVVGRGFLRRGVLVGRSEGALNLLRTALDNATRAPSTPQSTVTRRSSSSSPSTLSSASYTTAPSISPRSVPTFTLPLNTLADTTATLSSDLSLHSILNAEFKTTIYTSCLSSRWNGLPGGGFNGNVKGNINDRIMMHRFVSFVESRIQLMEECDVRLVVLVGRVEELGKGRVVEGK
ncbi:uncharacterized protein LY89DRAFT_349327 [Mollisia scopiformis]|uniref:Uncharacterized protein n=1 Tax=Mollisia scopiformis TaxID=149040 RepID=A0A132B7W4_MOLSC|nr:uncharacterized protein LY89DRAFT_349327 [Mollisia scopiformis]KUJ08079.1 hypothetical protein LY89DRAFT_349327 [Mollisia scopiformis]